MKRYKEYQPTQFDRKGAFLPDQGEWFVAPVIQTRDSDCLEKSNFEVALEMLGGESETVEVHRFGHWGPGWFEIIIVDCFDRDKVLKLEEIEASLENYPVLDEMHFSELEWNAATEYWEHMSIRERLEWCHKYNVSFLKARHDSIPEEIDISDLAG
jgi:hypothetical protein